MIKNNYSGKFIVVEGLDGSGQSSQVSLIKDFLIQQGKKVLATKEPTEDSEPGKKIKEILNEKEKTRPLDLQRLFAEDRKWHLENVIIPALKQGVWVVSDRYFFSSFAYGTSDGLCLEDLMNLNKDFLLPDQTFILKAKPETCILRIEKRGTAKTLFEKKEKLEKVWETYAVLPNKIENIIIIDGEKEIKKVFEDIKNNITKKL